MRPSRTSVPAGVDEFFWPIVRSVMVDLIAANRADSSNPETRNATGSRQTMANQPNSGSANAVTTSRRTTSSLDLRQAKYAQAFSQIIAVLMRDHNFRNMRLADIEWLVLPPLLAGQFRLGHTEARRPEMGSPAEAGKADDASSPKRVGSALIPVTAALWARVSPSVDKRLSENLDKPLLLQPSEWASGEILWLVVLAGDQRAMPAFLAKLREKEFKGRSVKLRSQAKGGATVVTSLQNFSK